MNAINKNHRKDINQYIVRDAKPEEFETVGQLMVNVYSQLDDFPSIEEQPEYYQLLLNIGQQTKKPKTRLLVAVSTEGHIGGGVVYFGDMQYYGSGGTATQEKKAAGFRLLAVSPETRGLGIGKLLSESCIQLAKKEKLNTMIIHSTKAMQIAWNMYEKIGFLRAKNLDFMQKDLQVFGFRLKL